MLSAGGGTGGAGHDRSGAATEGRAQRPGPFLAEQLHRVVWWWRHNPAQSRPALFIAVYAACATSVALLIRSTVKWYPASFETHFTYNPAAVVLAIELVKLIVATAFYFNCTPVVGAVAAVAALPTAPADSGGFETKFAALLRYKTVGAQYVATGFLYSAYLLFMFHTIRLLGPASFRVLINLRIVWVGVCMQYFGYISAADTDDGTGGATKKRLSCRQVLGMIVIPAACVLEQSGHYNPFSGSLLGVAFSMIMSWLIAMGGMSNQYLLQRRPPHEDSARWLWQSSIYQYAWSSALMLAYLWVFDAGALMFTSALVNFDARICAIIFLTTVQAFTGAFLMSDSSVSVVHREYANVIDMLLTVALNRVLFGSPELHWSTLIALVMIVAALWLYFGSSSNAFMVMHSPQGTFAAVPAAHAAQSMDALSLASPASASASSGGGSPNGSPNTNADHRRDDAYDPEQPPQRSAASAAAANPSTGGGTGGGTARARGKSISERAANATDHDRNSPSAASPVTATAAERNAGAIQSILNGLMGLVPGGWSTAASPTAAPPAFTSHAAAAAAATAAAAAEAEAAPVTLTAAVAAAADPLVPAIHVSPAVTPIPGGSPEMSPTTILSHLQQPAAQSVTQRTPHAQPFSTPSSSPAPHVERLVVVSE